MSILIRYNLIMLEKLYFFKDLFDIFVESATGIVLSIFCYNVYIVEDNIILCVFSVHLSNILMGYA